MQRLLFAFQLVCITGIFGVGLQSVGCAGATQIGNGPVVSVQYADAAEDNAFQVTMRADAVVFLQEMAADDYAGYRANAIEALSGEPVIGEDVARAGLVDENLGVRFSALMVIGMNQYHGSAALAHELLRDSDGSVRAAAVFALYENGINVNQSELGVLVKSTDLRTRSNAAMIIGELGEDSAIQLLREAMVISNQRVTVQEQRLSDLQIAEAMVKLGDLAAISRIRAHLRGHDAADGEVTALAASMLGRLGAKQYIQDLRNLVAAWKQYRQSAEVRLAAMASLAQMGDRIDPALPMEYFGSEYKDTTPGEFLSVRAQAMYVLGELSQKAALPYLSQQFYTSEEVPVRIQAAASILKLCQDSK